MKKFLLPLARRITQLTVIFFLFIIPLKSFEVSNIAQRGRDFSRFSDNILLQSYYDFNNWSGATFDNLSAFKGSLWALDIAGYRISEPLAFLETLASTGWISTVFFISVLPLLLITLFLGRVFCGWLCPVNLLLEYTAKFRNFFQRLGLPFRTVQFSFNIKYYLLEGGLVFSFFAGIPFLSFLYPPLIIAREAYFYVYLLPMTGLLFLLAIVFFEFLFSPRCWCRSFCPGGALYSLLGRLRILRISAEKAQCTLKEENCSVCYESCSMGLYPAGDDNLAECDNCGKCIADCPEKALSYRVRYFR